MSDFLPTDELRSTLDAIRGKVKPNTPEVDMREAITETLAEVDDLRFIDGKDCLSNEEIEWIRTQIEE